MVREAAQREDARCPRAAAPHSRPALPSRSGDARRPALPWRSGDARRPGVALALWRHKRGHAPRRDGARPRRRFRAVTIRGRDGAFRPCRGRH